MPTRWFYEKGDEEVGPLSSEELERAAKSGKLQPTDLIWHEGLTDWMPARKFKGLFVDVDSSGATTSSLGSSQSAPDEVTIVTDTGSPATRARKNPSWSVRTLTEGLGDLLEAFGSCLGALAIVALSVFSLFSIKGCVHTPWMHSSEIVTYRADNPNGSFTSVTLLPKNEAIIVFMSDSEGTYAEAALTRMRGEYGTHYFWRIWSLDEKPRQRMFPWRIYPKGAKPVVMEIETLAKRFPTGRGDPVLPKKGARSIEVVLVKEDAIRLGGVWLKKIPKVPFGAAAVREFRGQFSVPKPGD